MRPVLSHRSVRWPGVTAILLVVALGALSVGTDTAVAQGQKKKVSKGDAAVAKRSGKSYMKLRLFDKAIEQFEIAIEGNPKDVESQYWLGFLYSNRGLVEEMVQQFDKVRALKKGEKYKKDMQQMRNSWWTRKFNTGINAMKTQDFSEAIEEFQLAETIMPERADTYKGIGLCYLNMGQHEAGIESYLKAIELDSTDAMVRYNLGIAYLNINELESAKQTLLKAHKLDPEDLNALEKLALAEQRMGNPEGALHAAEKALKIDPDKLEVLSMAGQIYLMGDDYARAAELMEKVVAQQPDNAAVLFNLGAAYKALKQHDKAITQFLKTVEVTPNDTDAWYQLGLIYDHQEDLDSAIASFEKVVDLKPGNAKAWAALARAYARKSNTTSGAEAKELVRKSNEAGAMYQSLLDQGS
jgi:tetratricopeptide (TPR) repeat protein